MGPESTHRTWLGFAGGKAATRTTPLSPVEYVLVAPHRHSYGNGPCGIFAVVTKSRGVMSGGAVLTGSRGATRGVAGIDWVSAGAPGARVSKGGLGMSNASGSGGTMSDVLP